MNELLMSIKTKFTNEIFNGIKKYEFRKKSLGEHNLNKKVFIYSSEQDKAIIGYIIFSEIISGSSDEISNLDIKNKDMIQEYFGNKKECYALKVGKCVKFVNPISLKYIKEKCPNEVMPQYFKYLDSKSDLYNIILNSYEIRYISNYLDNNEFDQIYNKMYEMTKFLESTYKDYKNWFFNIQKNGILNKDREIIFVLNNDKVIAFITIKKSENKVSTLFVDENHRNLGIGTKLFDESFKLLKTDKPYFSINKENVSLLDKFIKKYNWKLTNELNNEYYYNQK